MLIEEEKFDMNLIEEDVKEEVVKKPIKCSDDDLKRNKKY